MPRRFSRAPLMVLAVALPLACGNDPQLSPLPGDSADAALSDGSLTPPSLACLASRIALGPAHSCALLVSGQVYCWGQNSQGELGQDNVLPSATPRPVQALARPAVQVTTARHRGCARLVDGTIACWGTIPHSNPESPEVRVAYPVALPGSTAQVVAGGGHVCALLSDDSVRCWGQPGRVGDGVRVVQPTPTPVPGQDKGVLALAAATDYSCALSRAGVVTCWGDIEATWLDPVSAVPGPALSPVVANSLGGNVAALAAGPGRLCALYRDGRIGCLPATGDPIIAGLDDDNQAVAVGQKHVCALKDSGAIACFGSNDNGQIARDPRLEIPAEMPLEVVALGQDNRAVAAGLAHTCALKSSGAVVCWGRAIEGQLGQGEGAPLPSSPDPITVAFPASGCP